MDQLHSIASDFGIFPCAGLMRDDTIHEDDDVKEALRRLPENMFNDRMFRIKRALDLSMKQTILPKEQWTKYEEVMLLISGQKQ